MATFDTARSRIVGYYAQQVWEYDGVAWTHLTPSPAPPYNIGSALAYDPTRARTLLFGGTPAGGSGNLGQTWEWDGQNWSMVATAGPSHRFQPLMTYHTGRGRVMLFGGIDSNNVSQNDLWEWDGVQWQPVPTTNPPPASVGGFQYWYTNLNYDAVLDRLVIYDNANPPTTWEWDASTGWQSFAAGGPIHPNYRVTFDLRRHAMVIVAAPDTRTAVQVWERSGQGNWVNRSPMPAPTFGRLFAGPLVYDPLRGRCLLLNSDGTLWAYQPVTPAIYEPAGIGCNGSAGIPALQPALPWSLPWLGETMHVRATGLPGSLAVLAMGFDDRFLGATPLPIELSPLGMPGCHLRLAPEAAVLLPGAGGEALYSLPIPNLGALRGVRFFQQAFVPDPGSNAMGATVSSAAVGIVGGR